MREDLQKKVDRAIRLLQGFDGEEPVEVAYSGGKDSDVILQLVKESGIKYRAIYKNTTIDPPGTIKHALEMGAEMIRPKKSFFELVEKNGLPNRFARFCCRYLKEYKVLDKAVMGVRRSESKKRADRYQEPTECKFYGSKKEHVEAIYPILDWTDEDVADFIADRGIKCAPVYYDVDGVFHVERRLGCMCCPLASINKRIAQFKEHPNMLRAYATRYKRYWDSHPDVKSRQNFSDIYEQLTRDIFFDNSKHMDYMNSGMFGKPDYKKALEDYFNVTLP